MNEEDRFEARHQEIYDANTGVTVTFGAHADREGEPRKGNRWMRITVPRDNTGRPDESGDPTAETKTSTVTFGPDGQVLKILPHAQASMDEIEPPPTEEDPKVVEIKEELAHLDEIEQSLPAKSDEVDKPTKSSSKRTR